jgi:hypothetical protein
MAPSPQPATRPALQALAIAANPQLPPARVVGFGHGLSPNALVGWVAPTEKVMDFLGRSRTREIIWIDFLGFGVIRTVLDLFRGAFYGQKDAPLNIPMARERILREIASILSDNVSAGVAAFGVGLAVDKLWQVPSNQFIRTETLDWLRHVQSASGPSVTSAPALRQVVAQSLIEARQHVAAQAGEAHMFRDAERPIQDALATLIERWPSTGPQQKKHLDAVANQIAQHLQLDRWDLPLALSPPTASAKRTWTQLPELLSDLVHVDRHVQKNLVAGLDTGWTQAFERVVQKTRRANHLKLACLSVAVGLTMAVPYAIRWVTRNVDQIEGYPGELGLAAKPARTERPAQALSLTLQPHSVFSRIQTHMSKPSTQRSPWARKLDDWFPYLRQSLKQGNFAPTLITLATVPFGFGLFDTYDLKFMSPFSKGLGPKWANLMQFGKGFPFTTQQQMASLFALLITSRLSSARTGNEYRERLVDSGLGWAIWILGTPLIKKAFATLSDNTPNPAHRTQLLKTLDPKRGLIGKAFRSRSEITLMETLATSPALKAMAQRTNRAHLAIDAASFALTLLLLGVVEPLIGIYWTKRRGAEAPLS